MPVTVANASAHALGYMKMPSTTLVAADELRFANNVQGLISAYYRWHWNITAATNVAVVLGDQDITMAAANQDKVLAIANANLLEGSTQQPALLVAGDYQLPLTSDTGQPYGCCLISPTVVRLYPKADASYTFQWRFHARPIIFTVNTGIWDCPEAFQDVIYAGMTWQILEWADDDRDEQKKKEFLGMLDLQVKREQMTMGRRRA